MSNLFPFSLYSFQQGMKHTLTLLLVTLCTGVWAQHATPPSGTYCSCPPTNARSSSFVTSIATKDFVKGFLVRISWYDLEPAKDIYDWTYLDQQIDSATKYGKYISLGIHCGPSTPEWVYNDGAQRLQTQAPNGDLDTIAVPWDPIFNQHWTDFIDTLGSRYNSDTSIRLVYMNTSTANGFEMQMPRTSTPTLTALGYTDSLMVSAWKQSIDAFHAAFTDKFLSNDFHPVNGSDAVGDSVFAYARKVIGKYHYGASAWWWTQNNTTVYPAQYSMLQRSAVEHYFTGVQVARNHTNDSAQIGPGGLPAAIELAMTDNICYWEVWSNDLQSPAFDSFFRANYCKPVDPTLDTILPIGINDDQLIDQRMTLYPNPATEILHISLTENDGSAHLQILHISGKVMLKEPVIGNNHTVNISRFSAGIYIVLLQTAEHPLHYQRLVVK